MGVVNLYTGDFLKNAGLVGLVHMLKLAGAKENLDYGIPDGTQEIWLDSEFVQQADWTQMYFDTLIEYYGPSTTYQRIVEKIHLTLDKLSKAEWKPEKQEKEDLKYINDKLLSNSYKAGFDNIKNQLSYPQVYEKLNQDKLKDKMGQAELTERLEELQCFLADPLCKETFTMKSIIYTYINRFWDGKCFLLRANAKKDIKELFEVEFSVPLRNYCKNIHDKDKDTCIDCGMPMGAKEKVSIAFMTEMADDLTRKRSAFWNGKVDAFLCPVCAFIYALSPLGFQLFANKFVFINTNDSIDQLLLSNNKKGSLNLETQKEEEESYSSWYSKAMTAVLDSKVKEVYNCQVILRGTNAEDRYLFSVIHKDVLNILKKPKIKELLQRLAKHPIVKIRNEYLNVYDSVIFNILQYQSQYRLLNRLLKASLDNDFIISTAQIVYWVQVRAQMIRDNKDKEGGNQIMSRYIMRDKGYALRAAVMSSKGASSDECLRGTIYQLLNALSVRNVDKFMDIIMRLYCSSKLEIPDGFIHMLGNPDRFQEYGYAFLMGLKGSHSEHVKEGVANE